MLAWVLAMILCPCPSVASRCAIKRNERNNQHFGMEASFDQSYSVIKGNPSIYDNKGTSLWNFFRNSTLLQPFNGLFSRTTWVSRYQKGNTNLDFSGARDSEWQWHQLGHMQVCTSLQIDNHASTPPLSFLQAGCPSCCPTNSVKALKAHFPKLYTKKISPHYIDR